jgi:alkylation response protein AidB-like acyl-CoA dehydrogenase
LFSTTTILARLFFEPDAVRATPTPSVVGRCGKCFEPRRNEGGAALPSNCYLKERRQFDRRIGSFQALQHRAARVHIEIEKAWSATLKALQSIEARAATAECLQMHGGIAMTDEFDIGLFLKRARVDSVLFGDAAFHADRVATMLGY